MVSSDAAHLTDFGNMKAWPIYLMLGNLFSFCQIWVLFPVFEGLFAELHSTWIMKLLYGTAEWHALAKLQMHSDSTLTLLDLLEDLTVEFEKLMHQFHDLTCSQFQTVELPQEEATRCQRQTKQQATTSSSASPTMNSLSETPPSGHSQPQSSLGSGWKAKSFNLFTIKFHFLGDYVCHICLFGTMDSFSTQLVCNFSKSTAD